MLIWMRQHGRKVFKVMVYPLIFVFIALYGSSQVQNQKALNEQTALWVNGKRVPYTAFLSTSEEIGRYYSSLPVPPEKPQVEMALEQLIQQELARQLASDLNLRTDDGRVRQVITQQLTGGTGVINQAAYRNFLRQAGFESHEQFREYMRDRMDVGLGLNYVRETALPLEEDIQRADARQQESREVEMLAFDVQEYVDQIEATTDEARQFFTDHRDRYRFPKRMKLQYVEALTQDFVAEATPQRENLQRWFRSVQERFVLPVERDVAVLRFDRKDFEKSVTVTDADLQQYFEQHADEYMQPARYQANFVAVSTQVPDASVEAIIQANPDDYRVTENMVAARHILLRMPPDEASIPAVKQQLEEIRGRISSQADFIREAKAHSDDSSNAPQGGDLGFFGRGRMVAPFEEVAFGIPSATVSQVVETRFGFHLLWIYDRKQAGDLMSIDQARPQVASKVDMDSLRQAARAQLEGLQQRLAGRTLSAASQELNMPLYTTDWFSRGEAPHEIAARDRYPFYNTVSETGVGEMSGIMQGVENVYLVEVLAEEPARRKNLEETYDQVANAYRSAEARELVQQKAMEAMALIQDGTVTFDQLAEQFGISAPVEYRNVREGQQQLPQNQGLDRAILGKVFTSPVGVAQGPVETLQGPVLMMVRREHDERLPELSDVEEEAAAQYRQVRASQMARDQVWELWINLDKYQNNLESAATGFRVSLKETDYFEYGQNVPGFASNSAVNYIAASLRVEGATSTVIEDPPSTPERTEPARAFYLLKVAALEEPRLPEFDEVSDEVMADLKHDKAVSLARAAAEQALAGLQSDIASATQPFSASRTVDLKAFADTNGYVLKGPFQTRYGALLGYVPGEQAGVSVVKTAFQLPVGGLSMPVEAVEPIVLDNRVETKVVGYYIVQVIAITPSTTPTATRREIVSTLGGRLQDYVLGDWAKRMQIQADIEINNKFFADSVINNVLAEAKQTN